MNRIGALAVTGTRHFVQTPLEGNCYNYKILTCPSCGPSGGAATACPALMLVFRYGGCFTFSATFFMPLATDRAAIFHVLWSFTLPAEVP